MAVLCRTTRRHSRGTTALAVVTLALLIHAGGCRPDDSARTPSPGAGAPEQITRVAPTPHAPSGGHAATRPPVDEAALAAQAEAARRLGAMGYLDFSPEVADPSRIGVVRNDRNRSAPGYNLYSQPGLSSAFLIDEEGTVIHSWKHEPSRHWSNCELLPNGDLLVPGMNPVQDKDHKSETNRYLLRLSWRGDVIWKLDLSAHHDVEVTPRDQILTLTDDYQRRPIRRRLTIRDALLTLLSHNGHVIDKLSLYDAIRARPDLLALRFRGVKRIRHRAKRSIDLFHANSIEWMHYKQLESTNTLYAPNNVLVSMRHQNAVAIINWDSRKLIWAWGPGEILGPHDASMLENGHIMIFDNGLGRGWSRVIEIDPMTRKIVWEYKAPTPTDFYTATRGSCQRLPNGNTLITDSNAGRAFEVTSNGQVVWDFYSPHLNEEGRRATLVRTKRYEPAFIERILAAPRPAGTPPTIVP